MANQDETLFCPPGLYFILGFYTKTETRLQPLLLPPKQDSPKVPGSSTHPVLVCMSAGSQNPLCGEDYNTGIVILEIVVFFFLRWIKRISDSSQMAKLR